MSSIPVPGYFEILQSLLLDYSGQVDINGNQIDVSQGSAAFIDSAVLASALQGIYYRIAASEGYALPSVGQTVTAALEGWCSVFGVSRVSGESDAELLIRLSSRIQEPPSGGNKSDWIRWGRDLVYHHSSGWDEVIIDCSVVENARSSGSVDLYLYSRKSDAPEWSAKAYPKGEIVRFATDMWRTYEAIVDCPSSAAPYDATGVGFWVETGGCSSAMAQYARDVIEEKRVLGVWDNYYNPCTIEYVRVDVIVDTVDDLTVTKGEISGMIESLEIGAPITQAQIIAICVSGGATSVNVIYPTADKQAVAGVKYLPLSVTILVQ